MREGVGSPTVPDLGRHLHDIERKQDRYGERDTTARVGVSSSQEEAVRFRLHYMAKHPDSKGDNIALK